MINEERKDIILSIHVCNVPSPEEYYMGVDANYEAHFILLLFLLN